MKHFLFALIFSTVLFSCSNGEDSSSSYDNASMTEDDRVGSSSTFTPCENGMAGEYPCNGYDLLGRIWKILGLFPVMIYGVGQIALRERNMP